MKKEDAENSDFDLFELTDNRSFSGNKIKSIFSVKKGKFYKDKTKEEKLYLFKYGFLNALIYGIFMANFFLLHFKYRLKINLPKNMKYLIPMIFSAVFSPTGGFYSMFVIDPDKIKDDFLIINFKSNSKEDK